MFKSRSRLGGGYWRFPHLASCFLRLAAVSHMFSRGWQRLRVFTRAWHRFMLSRACHRLHAFPRLPSITCFPTFGTGYTPSTMITCFHALEPAFEILKISLIVRPRGHKQKKWIDMLIQFVDVLSAWLLSWILIFRKRSILHSLCDLLQRNSVTKVTHAQ